MQHDCPLIVMQLPLEPEQASRFALTAGGVELLRGSGTNGPGAGPLRATLQVILGHATQPHAFDAALPSPL
jgi:hypothetical protein